MLIAAYFVQKLSICYTVRSVILEVVATLILHENFNLDLYFVAN